MGLVRHNKVGHASHNEKVFGRLSTPASYVGQCFNVTFDIREIIRRLKKQKSLRQNNLK